jgi:Mce-associated membrane protein
MVETDASPAKRPDDGSCEAGVMTSDNEDEKRADVGVDADDDATSSSTPDDEHAEKAAEDSSAEGGKARRALKVSVSLRSLLVAGLCVVLLAGAGVLAWLYVGERAKVNAQHQQAADYQHAEQISLDYAVNAATMNFQDLNAWKGNLVKGTTPELTDKLSKAATQMEQLLVPLEWSSTAQALVAKVRSDTNGVYVVDTFVSVLTKTTQAPDNLQSTATYSITIDSKNNWQITDVGGIGAVTAPK